MERLDNVLLTNIKKNLPELEKLLQEISDHWQYEDVIYRMYHQSYKVSYARSCTDMIVNKLKSMAPEGREQINDTFNKIYKDGINAKLENRNWDENVRPIIEAFLHAKYFLEMAVKYGKELETAPSILPSGWAGLLYFYNMR